MAALIVFTESLKYLIDSLLNDARKQQSEIHLQDIKWILTVPAIWSDPAKAFMRKAAVGVHVICWINYTIIFNNKMLSLVIHAWAIKVVILQKIHICGSNFNIRIQGDKFLIKSSLKPIGQRSCNLNQCSFTFYFHFLSSNYDLYG